MTELKKRLKYNPLQTSVKKRGVALIMAITSLMFMVYIATEVSKDSLTEFAVNSQELNRIKTYYAARSSMQIALLRVKIFQQASRMAVPPGFSKYLDKLWNFPFAWPLATTSDSSSFDKEAREKMNAESLMDTQYYHTIEDEGSKIDLNDLASPSKTLRQITKTQILNIFKQKVESNEEFRQEYQNFNFEDLVNQIIDWMSDSDTAAGNSGDKKAAFSQLGEGYPPNRGFRTIDELRLLPLMTEEFFSMLSPRITIYGMKAINPNTAPAEVLKSLDPNMTDEAVKAAVKKRDDPEEGGPFTGEGANCLTNFKSYVEQHGANRLSEDFDKIPMICDKVINFRIKASGIYGSGSSSMKRSIEAVVIDLGRSAQQIKTSLENEKPKDPSAPANDPNKKPNPTSSAGKQEPLPKGPPRVVYWTEY